LLALEAFRVDPQRFALVVTDNTMPHLTGLELAQRIRNLRAEVPILMLSGTGEALSLQHLKEHGVHRLLPKPYLSDALKTAALELLRPGAPSGPDLPSVSSPGQVPPH